MSDSSITSWRVRFVLGFFAVGAAVLCWRAVDLQVVNNDYYQTLGEAIHIKTVTMPAHRGMIKDRNGEPLAISTPVDSIWVNPAELAQNRDRIPQLAKVLQVSLDDFSRQLERKADKNFVFVKRRVPPALAQEVRELEIPGVNLQPEFRRFYPTGEVAATLLGVTNIDDRGQEGIELGFNKQLGGVNGSKRVLQDRHGRAVSDVELLTSPRPGQDLMLSIDKRIQYLAYRELKAAMNAHNALSGSMVVLDSETGEVLAMVNQPSFNPHSQQAFAASRRGNIRNRALTDLFEPGSTIKPFTIAAALEAGVTKPSEVIDTAPGYMKVGRHRVQDVHNYGPLDIAGIIRKSSNVGVATLALRMEREDLYQRFSNSGFGAVLNTGFPGESNGWLNNYRHWSQIDQATLSFGYGVAVNALQLARAYTVLADDGRLKSVSLQHLTKPPRSVQVFKPETIRLVRHLMEAVVSSEGTAPLARIPGYSVAGKTGTVRKHLENGGYSDDQHVALFAGLVPASHPKLVAVVVIDSPNNGQYYGGAVAAPVFANVMAGALRLLDIPPDALEAPRVTVAQISPVAAKTSVVR